MSEDRKEPRKKSFKERVLEDQVTTKMKGIELRLPPPSFKVFTSQLLWAIDTSKNIMTFLLAVFSSV